MQTAKVDARLAQLGIELPAATPAWAVEVGGFVSSAAGFVDQPKVLNGASDLIVEVFGDAGRHTRFAVGVAVLPFDFAVEVKAVFEVAAG